MSKIYNSKNYLFGDKVYVINGDGTEFKEYTLSKEIYNLTGMGIDTQLMASSGSTCYSFPTPSQSGSALNFDVGVVSEKIVTDKKEIEHIKAMIFAEEI